MMTIFTKPIVAEKKYETVRKHQFQLPNFKNKSFDFFKMQQPVPAVSHFDFLVTKTTGSGHTGGILPKQD